MRYETDPVCTIYSHMVNRFTKPLYSLKPRKASIKDVAQAAGLSPTTVSRYLNRGIVLPARSANRIDEAVRLLGYRPDHLARNLSLGKSHLIGLIIPEISNPFFAALASAVEDVAFAAEYGVLICNTHNDVAREFAYLRLLASRQLDGIAFLTCQANNPELVAALNQNSHVVLVDEDIDGVKAGRVFCENRAGGRSAAEYLIDRGHVRIGFIGGPENLLSSRERYAGFVSACGERGLAHPQRFVSFGPYTADFGRRTATQFLGASRPPTAIFATSDYVALGVLHAATDLGLHVPQDLSLVGFDDMPFAADLSPALTTIRQPIHELGKMGAELLLRSMDGAAESNPTLRLPVKLIERSSVRRQKTRTRVASRRSASLKHV
jgi:LacI family transcriptional regulator, galactose operon repressor